MSALEEDLARIEEGTFKLQKEWERFFSGQERKAPFEAKQRLDRLIRRYVGVEIRNNVERFRFQSLTARYNTLADLWNRRLRAIEEGRPMSSTQMKQARVLAQESAVEAVAPLAAAQRLEPGATPPPARSEIRLSTLRDDDEGVKNLYEQFRAARASVGESEVKFESFRKLISQQRARLLDEKDAVAVDFRVALQDGKVALKAKPVRID
ncbi:MAG: MXAN_5187 C-terminal domain-containing protein [Vicinamibacteria bacterium]